MEGYTKIATLMGAYPEVAIFRRFAALNTQNLLYLQAELIHLESRLRRLENADQQSGDRQRQLLSFDWYKLSTFVDEPKAVDPIPQDQASVCGSKVSGNSKEDESVGSERWTLVLEIRAKLKEYSEC